MKESQLCMQLDEKKEEKTCKTIAQKSKFGQLFTRIYTNSIDLKIMGKILINSFYLKLSKN